MNTENAKRFLEEYGIKDRYIFDSEDNNYSLDWLLEEYHQTELKNPKKINLDTRISDIDWSVRAYNCLKAREIRTLRDLVGHSTEELMGYWNFGRRTLLEIEQFVTENGLSFKDNNLKIQADKSPNVERNTILFQEFNNGVSRKDLSIKYKLSYDRVCQLINRFKRKTKL
jgi:DNA-directed RNA polymerase alpha subunit